MKNLKRISIVFSLVLFSFSVVSISSVRSTYSVSNDIIDFIAYTSQDWHKIIISLTLLSFSIKSTSDYISKNQNLAKYLVILFTIIVLFGLNMIYTNRYPTGVVLDHPDRNEVIMISISYVLFYLKSSIYILYGGFGILSTLSHFLYK